MRDTSRYDKMTWCRSTALRGAEGSWGLSGVDEHRRPEEQVTHGTRRCLRLSPSNGSFKPLVTTVSGGCDGHIYRVLGQHRA